MGWDHVGFGPNGPVTAQQGRRHEPIHPRRRPRRFDQRHRICLAAQSHRRYRRRKSYVRVNYIIISKLGLPCMDLTHSMADLFFLHE